MEINEKRDVPIDVIKRSVSHVSRVSMEDMDASNKVPLARQRHKVSARQISMTLCKTYTRASLAVIGLHHGGHDHATVLHAAKTVNNLIDTKDPMITLWFNESDKIIQQWKKNHVPMKEKAVLVKHWIKNHVPLFVRWKILNSFGKTCPLCGGKTITINYHGNKIKAVSGSL